MKKYLIAFAAMAVAVSSCAEKMSSGDNVPDGGDKMPEKTKLVRRITETDWPDEDITTIYDFKYDGDNRIVKIIANRTYFTGKEETWTQSRVYSGNTVTIIDNDSVGTYAATVWFDGNKITEFIKAHWTSSLYFLYDNNSEKVTATADADGEVEYEYIWDERGNMVKVIDENEKYVIPISYTSKINKCNVAIEYEIIIPFPGVYFWVDRNVFGSICSNYLVKEIDFGDYVSIFSYKFDEDDYPIEVYVPGGVYDTPDGGKLYVSSEKYEIEYY